MRLWTIGMVLLVSASATRAQAHPDFDWSLPIHRDPYGEIWASGPSYKVRFGDGVDFVPVLGPHAEVSTPWSWDTTDVRLGDRTLLDAGTTPEVTWSDWRHNRRLGSGIVEIHEIRPEGVEQVFVVEVRPAGRGDLVVRGRVRGLRGIDRADFAHGALTFVDAHGTPTVVYGAAVAFDAAGTTTRVETRLVDGMVELRVPSSWVAAATFPITIDPLISNNRYPGARPEKVDVTPNAQHVLLLTTSRAVSASDYDLAAVELDPQTLAPGATVMTDLSTAWSTRYAQCASGGESSFGQSTAYWLVAAQRDSARSGAAHVWIYSQVVGGTPNSGTWTPIPGSAGASQRFPSLSGSNKVLNLDQHAIVAYQEDAAVPARNTANSAIYWLRYDPITATISSGPTLLAGDANSDHEWPSVTRSRVTDGAYIAWQSKGSGRLDTWDVKFVRIQPTGVWAHTFAANSGDHEIRPVIARSVTPLIGGEMVTIAYTLRDTAPSVPTPDGAGHAVAVRVVHWDPNAGITFLPQKTIANATGQPRVTTGDGVRGIAPAHATNSHAAIAFTWDGTGSGGTRDTEIVRIGQTGGTVERAVLQAGTASVEAFAPAVCPSGDGFVVAWASTSPSATRSYYAHAARFLFENAQSSSYGSGCRGTLRTINNYFAGGLPHAGSRLFGIDITSGLANAPTYLLVGASGNGRLALPGGCRFYVLPSPLLYGAATTSAQGSARFFVPLPDDPVLVGDFYWQALQVSPRSGALLTSDPLVTRIR